MSELRTLPTLDEVAHHPELAAELAPGMLKALLVKHATVGTILLGALLVAGENGKPPESDVLLDVETAARRLATTEDWLYRHARQLPFAGCVSDSPTSGWGVSLANRDARARLTQT